MRDCHLQVVNDGLLPGMAGDNINEFTATYSKHVHTYVYYTDYMLANTCVYKYSVHICIVIVDYKR